MNRLLLSMVAFALSSAAYADTVTPEFNLTGVWSSLYGGTPTLFQEGTQVSFINVNGGFAHYFVGRYITPMKVEGIQHRVDRATGCGTDQLVTITAVSYALVHIWTKALDSHCDLRKDQTFTDTNRRIL